MKKRRTAVITFDADLSTGLRENLEVRVDGARYTRVDKNPVGRQFTLHGSTITLGTRRRTRRST